MNKRSVLKILLDTSFLLPSLGFRTNREVMEVLPLLRRFDVYYSELSVLEALWKIVKLVDTDEKIRIVAIGIDLIRKTFKRAEVDEKAIEVAITMYRRGHRDMIDNILYGISVSQNMLFLTLDRELGRFVEEHGMPTTLIYPSELYRLIEE